MKRRRFVATVGSCIPLAGCSGFDRGRRHETGQSRTEVATGTAILPDLVLANARETAVTGTIRLTPSSTVTRAESGFDESFRFGPDEGRTWADIDMMEDRTRVEVSADYGTSGTYDWEGGAKFNVGLSVTIEENEIDFIRRIA